MYFLIPLFFIFISSTPKALKEFQYETIENGNIKYYSIVLENKENKQIFWKVYKDLKSLGKILPEKEDFSFYVSKNNDIVYYGEDFYMFKKKNFCWDNEDKNGKYRICINEVKDTFILNDNYKVKNCYIFKKQYYISSELSQAFDLIYINPSDYQIFKTEKFNESGQIILSEKLIKID